MSCAQRRKRRRQGRRSVNVAKRRSRKLVRKNVWSARSRGARNERSGRRKSGSDAAKSENVRKRHWKRRGRGRRRKKRSGKPDARSDYKKPVNNSASGSENGNAIVSGTAIDAEIEETGSGIAGLQTRARSGRDVIGPEREAPSPPRLSV
jgi:hypothetical protein